MTVIKRAFSGVFPSGSNGISLYNTTDQVTNYERLIAQWTSNVARLGLECGGTGTLRKFAIGVNATAGSAFSSTTGRVLVIKSDLGSGQGFYDWVWGGTGLTGSIFTMRSPLSASSGLQKLIGLYPQITQTSSAGYKIIYVSPFISTSGGGVAYLIDVGTNSASDDQGTHTSKFSVDVNGNVVCLASGSITIPQGSNPTVDAVGKIAFDTTSEQFLCGDSGNAAFVVGAKTKSITFVLDAPTSTDVFPIWQAPYAVTVTKVVGTILGGTSYTFNIEERSATTLNSAGTDVMTSDLAADQDGENTTTFSNPGIASDSFLVLAASAISGTVGQIVIRIDYTIDRI
jgi:hypothetical protein